MRTQKQGARTPNDTAPASLSHTATRVHARTHPRASARTHPRAIPIIAAASAAIVCTALVGIGAIRETTTAGASAANPLPRDVIVHLFQWPWSSVANECTTVLGPKGYGGVQVSPPQEHVMLADQTYPWWQDYQPVSYQLVSRRGDRAAFATMVRTCHTAGVKVYVDAVVNHMAGGASTGTGSGGSTYGHYSYPAVPYGNGDFHHCGRNGTDDIKDWSNTWEIQNCELVDLADLTTESSYVRGKLTGYLNDLVSLGVDGFRVDAAKHLPPADLSAILAPVAGDPYIYSEVIEGGTGEPTPEEYTGIGDVTEFRYGDQVSMAFRDGALSGLNGIAGRMRLSSGDAVAFIDNHDTQRNGRNVLTYKNGTPYTLAAAFMIAYPYGVPQVMSSFTFNGSDQGPPTAGNGTTSQANCGGGWECEHRQRAIANMVGLRNAATDASDAAVTNWWSNGSNQIAFGRGDAAFVAFNRSGTALTRTFHTSLPAGGYCDVMSGDFTAGACTGTAYSVDSSGQVTATVPANGALALHIDARGGSPTTSPTGTDNCTTAQVSVAATVSTVWGENVFIVGNAAALGNWSPDSAVPLSATTYPIWRATIALPANTSVRYKFIKKNGSQVTWESDPNRVRTTPAASPCTATWSDTWR